MSLAEIKTAIELSLPRGCMAGMTTNGTRLRASRFDTTAWSIEQIEEAIQKWGQRGPELTIGTSRILRRLISSITIVK
jgi:hypothetical protein